MTQAQIGNKNAALCPKGKIRFQFVLPWFKKSKKRRSLGVVSVLWAQAPFVFALEDLVVAIGTLRLRPILRLCNPKKRARRHVCVIAFTVTFAEVEQLSIHSSVLGMIPGSHGQLAQAFSFNVLLRAYRAARGPYLRDDTSNLVAFFRQSRRRGTVLTVRHQNYTDTVRARAKLVFTALIAKVAPLKPPVLVYEKNASKYEESGKVVFEALINRGYKHVYFIISRKALESASSNERYRPYFLIQHSFRHYLYFFKAKVFIGTEALEHALELRVQSYVAQKQVRNARNTFVFLQHGPSYMVSLDSLGRNAFTRQSFPGTARVAVNSRKEAEHFIEAAGFSSEELIVSGMAKFDTSYQNKDADKILIMPTWRIWEFNAVRTAPESTSYVAMTRQIEAAIPKELRSKVITRYHPLFQAATFSGGFEKGQLSLDELLREVRLFITDYSSLAYDAFYRGAKVVFFWKDLEECLRHYGEPTRLLLNSENTFGDICYSQAELESCLEDAYYAPQKPHYVERYQAIITHHDGKNTKRLIEALEADRIIER